MGFRRQAFWFLSAALAWASLGVAAEKGREIPMETKKIGDAVHWTPEVVKVKQGETVTFVVKHELEGGFDTHGFSIDALKIATQANRGQKPPLTITTTIPSTLAPGEYPIGCQFHKAHVGAKLVVEAATAPKKKS